jgi:hypothetical protein
MGRSPLGTCCEDMRHARDAVPESFLRIADNGVLYLTVGMAMTDGGPGYFDQAMFFCPFCGTHLQTREDVARAPRL